MKRLGLWVTVALLSLWALPSSAAVASTVLNWTAPGNDGMVGTASQYAARFSTTQPDPTSQTAMAAWWTQATGIGGLPLPTVAGTPQSVVVSPVGGFTSGATYYFVMRTADGATPPNWSGYSNVAVHAFLVVDTVPPAAIIDLRSP